MEEQKEIYQNKKTYKNKIGSGASGGVYGLAFIGALIYFLQNATDFYSSILGILKAIVWPAMLVYKVLVFLSA